MPYKPSTPQDLSTTDSPTFAGLTVNGTLTTIQSTNTVIADKLIELANGTTGTPSGDSGIVVERGDSTNAALVWDESGDTWVAATTSATGASTGDLTLTPTDLNISDLSFTPDGITTSHITTAGSLKIRATNSLDIGDDDADSVKIGRTNTALAKVHLRSGTDTLIVSDSKVGIGTDAPSNELDVVGTIAIDKNVTSTTAGTYTAASIDFDKTGASTSDNTLIGLDVDMDNTTATAGTNTMVAAKLTPTLQHASAAGVTLVKGLEVTATGSGPGNTTTRALDLTATGADFNQGVFMKIDNGGPDIKMLSSANNADFCTIATGANGELTIETTDGSGAAGHINLKPDGDVVIKGATPKLVIGDGDAEDSMLVFDGNAADFRIGIDDGTDTLEIGKGSTMGTTAVIKVDSSTNCQVMHNTALADGEYSGDLAMFTAGEDLTQGEICYLKSDGKLWKASATSSATSRAIAMCVAPVSADAMGPFLIRGFARFDSEFGTYSNGDTLYTPEAETSGKNVPENAAPDTDGDYVQIIGYSIGDAVFMHFNSTVIEVA